MFLSVEVDEVLLPELSRVNWAPAQLLSLDLVFELVDRAEYFLILFKELVEILKQFVDVAINPMSLIELLNDALTVDV